MISFVLFIAASASAQCTCQLCDELEIAPGDIEVLGFKTCTTGFNGVLLDVQDDSLTGESYTLTLDICTTESCSDHADTNLMKETYCGENILTEVGVQALRSDSSKTYTYMQVNFECDNLASACNMRANVIFMCNAPKTTTAVPTIETTFIRNTTVAKTAPPPTPAAVNQNINNDDDDETETGQDTNHATAAFLSLWVIVAAIAK